MPITLHRMYQTPFIRVISFSILSFGISCIKKSRAKTSYNYILLKDDTIPQKNKKLKERIYEIYRF